MNEFIAFRAAMNLLEERGMMNIAEGVYRKCKAAENLPKEELRNYVKAIYEPFADDEISDRIAAMLTPESVHAEVRIVFQTVENLHNAIPGHPGDWYFTGDYPTPGGIRLVNRAFINFYEGLLMKR